MTSRNRLVTAALLALALVVAACGGDSDETTTTAGSGDTTQAPPDTTGSGGLTGQIVISGSSTVEPITGRVAEDFGGANPEVRISVDGPGTSDGFVLFCNGETDISDASRAIREEEVETCLANGVEPIEIKVAIDGLSVLTSTQNTDVTCLDFGDLYALLGSESTAFNTWAAANDLAAEIQADGLGASHAPYADVPLVITAPGEESGTFDSFIEIVLADTAEARGTDENPRPDYVASPNDNVIIEGISSNDTSLGWVGYAFFIENQDVVAALEVDGGDGCVAPTPETIASGEYPISRPLFIYVNKAAAEEKPALSAFVDFYLSEAGLANVGEAGYVDLTPDENAEWLANWEAGNVGKVD
ncbi:MAG TPA: phosphate ABC transporter substrate-binding protein PstS family protein [Acidimicrobiia bacterium]|jgi:phosphate transport system substrate-binding protein